MAKRKQSRWSVALTLTAIKIFWFVAGCIPLSVSGWLARILGAFVYGVSSRQRNIALESLAIAFPEKKDRERQVIARDFFVGMIQSAFEACYFVKHKDRIKECVRFEGREYLDAALEQGHGVMGVGAHFGNFMLMHAAFVCQGYRIGVMARPMRVKAVSDYFGRVCESVGVPLIYSLPRKEAVGAVLQALRDNRIVLVHMDQDFHGQGAWVDFFGRPASTPTGPVVLAMRTQARIVPVTIVREAVGRHCVKIMPPIDFPVDCDRDQSVLRAAQMCSAVIEDWIRQYPAHWGWIHRRWKSQESH
jgi:KDO2-lipid IV(A) lauroyltransferase